MAIEKHALILLGDLLTLPGTRLDLKWRVTRIETETQKIHLEPVPLRATVGPGPWCITVEPSSIPESL